MLNYWNDFDRTFAALDELRRHLDLPRMRTAFARQRPWPHVEVSDNGATLSVTAEVPGLTADAIELELNQDTLKLSGERTIEAPEGYSVHRQERPAVKFSRSFTLPVQVDPEKVSAEVRDGVLSITLEKAAAVKPRHIAIKSL